ncbi:MAG: nuclear transport factor 2 family protein [Candidatus Acidiferrales bacterium]|jgi:ketosteroid isomerase-like protein
MKRLFALAMFVGLALTASGIASAQGGNAEQEVRGVLKQMIDADLNGNAGALDRTTTDDYTITRDNGVVRSKAETLQGIKDGTTKFDSFEMSDIRVRIYGQTAVVTFHEDIKGSRAGKDMSGQFREVRVFVKSGGKWRAVMAQRTRIVS